MAPADIDLFFNQSRDAFNRLDGDAVADLWHSPSGITDSEPSAPQCASARLTWWPTDAAMRANMHALCEVYRKAGFGSARFEWMACVAMGANHVFAHLRWTLQRTDGTLLQQFATGYQLLRTAAGWRVMLAIAYSENIREIRDASPTDGPFGPGA